MSHRSRSASQPPNIEPRRLFPIPDRKFPWDSGGKIELRITQMEGLTHSLLVQFIKTDLGIDLSTVNDSNSIKIFFARITIQEVVCLS